MVSNWFFKAIFGKKWRGPSGRIGGPLSYREKLKNPVPTTITNWEDAASFWDLSKCKVHYWECFSLGPEIIPLNELSFARYSLRFSIQKYSIVDITFGYQFAFWCLFRSEKLNWKRICRYTSKEGWDRKVKLMFASFLHSIHKWDSPQSRTLFIGYDSKEDRGSSRLKICLNS
jgi:hypothetical protein